MKKQKKKLLAWCDFNVSTGFSTVTMNLLDEMHKEYDVEIVAVNYHGFTRYDTTKWFAYPVTPQDPLGFQRLMQVLDSNPDTYDVVFLFQDVFHVSDLCPKVKEKAPNAKIVTYFPVDGAPFNMAWNNALTIPDVVITYSDWAKEMILDRFPDTDPDKIRIMYHGVNFDDFYAMPESERKMCRIENGWEGRFVVGCVNRFQPRKAIPLLIRAFALFFKGYKVCKCGNWYIRTRSKCDLNMCPAEDVVEEVKGHNDVLLYLHMMAVEHTMGPGPANTLQAHLINAGFENEDIPGNLLINARDIYGGKVPISDVNKIYNASDVNISAAVGEGCGLSLIESAATGTTSIAPKNSAIPEMIGETGHLVPNLCHFNMSMDNGHLRPIVDVREMVKALEIEYQKWRKNGRKKVFNQDAVDRAKNLFAWADKKEFIGQAFKDALSS